MSKFILSIDEGTTATTAMVVQSDLTVIGKAFNEIPRFILSQVGSSMPRGYLGLDRVILPPRLRLQG